MASDWKHLLHFPLNSMTQLQIITQQGQDDDTKAQRHKRLFYLPVSSLLHSSAFIILRYERLNAVQSYADSSPTVSAASLNLSGHFVKASENRHMLHKLSAVTLFTSPRRARGSASSRKFLCHKMKASRSARVTLAKSLRCPKNRTRASNSVHPSLHEDGAMCPDCR